jgi:hypothetical protein
MFTMTSPASPAAMPDETNYPATASIPLPMPPAFVHDYGRNANLETYNPLFSLSC